MKRRPTVSTKLNHSDFSELEKICRLDDKTKTEVVREAILSYLKQRADGTVNERESFLEERIHKMENRIASIMVKIGLDIGTVHQYIWLTTDKEVRQKLFDACRTSAVDRMRKKLSPKEIELKDSAKKAS